MEAESVTSLPPQHPQKQRHGAFHFAGIALVVLAVVGVLIVAWRKRTAEADERNARQGDVAAGTVVQTANVTKGPAGRPITLMGEVFAMRKATLYAKVSGYVREVRVDKGQRVKAGDLLGVLQSPETDQQVLETKADLVNKRLVEDRYQKMMREGLITQQQLDQATADRTISQGEQARLEVLRGYEVIRAPFDGVVTARFADPGWLLQAATSSNSALPLVEVSDMDLVRVRIYLAQSEALFVHEKDPASIWTDQNPDRKVSATVTRFARGLDPKTRTMLTEIDVDNKDGALYPGVFVRVKLNLTTPPALTMPADALVFRNNKTMAFVVRDSKAVLVPVGIGDTDGTNILVREGLNAGDTVILHPGDDVIEGAKVRAATKEKLTASSKP